MVSFEACRNLLELSSSPEALSASYKVLCNSCQASVSPTSTLASPLYTQFQFLYDACQPSSTPVHFSQLIHYLYQPFLRLLLAPHSPLKPSDSQICWLWLIWDVVPNKCRTDLQSFTKHLISALVMPKRDKVRERTSCISILDK